MKKISVPLITALLFFGSVFPLVAAEGGESASPLLDFIFKVINFAILFGIIYYFAKKPIANGLKNSAQSAKQNLEEAREAQKQAEAELEEFRGKLAQMKQEAQAMVAEARKDAEAEKERIIAEGQQTAERMKAQVRVAVEQEYKKAELEIKQWTAEETVKMAEKLIEEKIEKTHHDHLIKDYLNQLQ